MGYCGVETRLKKATRILLSGVSVRDFPIDGAQNAGRSTPPSLLVKLACCRVQAVKFMEHLVMSQSHLMMGVVDHQPVPSTNPQSVINSLVGLLWSDQYFADAFNGNKRGWQAEVARALSIEPNVLRKAIGNFGAKKLAALASNNPAGEAPSVAGFSETFVQMQYSNQACQETAAACPSGNSCGTCWCTSGQCVVAPPQQIEAAV
jgi:hypothetical protein